MAFQLASPARQFRESQGHQRLIGTSNFRIHRATPYFPGFPQLRRTTNWQDPPNPNRTNYLHRTVTDRLTIDKTASGGGIPFDGLWGHWTGSVDRVTGFIDTTFLATPIETWLNNHAAFFPFASATGFSDENFAGNGFVGGRLAFGDITEYPLTNISDVHLDYSVRQTHYNVRGDPGSGVLAVVTRRIIIDQGEPYSFSAWQSDADRLISHSVGTAIDQQAITPIITNTKYPVDDHTFRRNIAAFRRLELSPNIIPIDLGSGVISNGLNLSVYQQNPGSLLLNYHSGGGIIFNPAVTQQIGEEIIDTGQEVIEFITPEGEPGGRRVLYAGDFPAFPKNVTPPSRVVIEMGGPLTSPVTLYDYRLDDLPGSNLPVFDVPRRLWQGTPQLLTAAMRPKSDGTYEGGYTGIRQGDHRSA